MASQRLKIVDSPELTAVDVLVSRQPVVDAELRVSGCRVA
jgi:hypothetical protein